jgi:hypothetical protein
MKCVKICANGKRCKKNAINDGFMCCYVHREIGEEVVKNIVSSIIENVCIKNREEYYKNTGYDWDKYCEALDNGEI